MGSNASLLDLIAHGGSLRASQDNQQQQAQTQGIQANTDLTNTQIPVQQELAKQEALKTQVAQRQLRDEEIQRQIWTDIGKQSTAPQPAQGNPTASAATPVGGAPQVTPGAPQGAPPPGGGAPQIATPAINPNAPAANAPMVPDYLGNPRALATEMARRGASAPAVMDAFKNGIAMNTNITKMNGDQLDNELKALGMVKNTITGYLASPSDQSYADAYDAVNKTDPAVGHTMPKPAQGFAPTQDQLAHVVGLSGALEQMAANAKTKQETATSAASANQANAGAAKQQFDTERERQLLPTELAAADTKAKQEALTLAGTSPTGVTAKDLASAAETQRHNKQTEFAAQRELAIKQKQFDATYGAGLNEFGQPLPPEALKEAALQDPTAQAIARYQIPGPPAQTRGGVPSPILRKVLAINPNYDGTQYAARNKVQQDFSAAGASGKLITSADTALAHLDSISKAGQALNNGDIQQLNRLANAAGAQLGQTPKQTYDTIVSMVSPEISKAVIGDAGGEGERASMAKNFSSNSSPQQREAAISAAAGLLTARVHKQAQAYESSIGAPLDLTKRLSPESQAVIQKYAASAAQAAPKAQMIRARDPQGALHEAPAGTPLPAGWKAE